MTRTAASPLDVYLTPAGSPEEPPGFEILHPATRELHEAVDENMRRSGRPHLVPEGESVPTDLLGSGRVAAWQEAKAAASFLGESCWSELAQTYGRYGTESTRELARAVRELESARGAVVTGSGMQAVAVLFDALLEPEDHVVVARTVYNKSKGYLAWLRERLRLGVTLFDGDARDLDDVLTDRTRLVFVETFSNPLLRALDPSRWVSAVRRGRRRSPGLRLIVDDTLATPWGLVRPLLEHGVDFVVASGTKALDGRDRNLWGYVASNRVVTLNACMDLLAMRGGVLDGGRARSVLDHLDRAREHFLARCRTASELARFLARHPKVAEVWHPSLPEHPDRAVVDRHYREPGSIVSFRIEGDDERARHFTDVLAMTGVLRYALGFDGLTSKVNHHRTVSEYFTPAPEVERLGADRLVRVAVGLEAARDLVAACNWALWNHERVAPDEVRAWQAEREAELGLAPS